MNSEQSTNESPDNLRGFRATAWIVLLMATLAVVAYSNSLDGVYVLDDYGSIPFNPSIQTLWPITTPLAPPKGSTVAGRPLLNLSFAVNYAIDGTRTRGYHVVNLLIHFAAAVTLFAIVRNVLWQPSINSAYRQSATALGVASAAIWMVHPLQTESVTYVVQRAESLSGLLILLSFYCAVRALHLDRDSAKDTNESSDVLIRPAMIWRIAAIIVCFLATLTKETALILPLIVAAYDYCCCTRSIRETVQRRWGFYLGLLATWALLASLIVTGGFRSGTVTSEKDSIDVLLYATTQIYAIIQYLRLSLWPDELVFDYGFVTYQLGEVWLRAVLLAAIIVATIVACFRVPQLAFLGIVFFIGLGPTSSVVPIITQTIAEHRMYVSLAPVCVLAVLAVFEVLRQAQARLSMPVGGVRIVSIVFFCAATTVLTWLTIDRNRDYHSAIALWGDVVKKRPENQRAHTSLGNAYYPNTTQNQSGEDLDKAITHYRAAIEIDASFYEAHYNLANALNFRKKQSKKAIHHYNEAIRLHNERYRATHPNRRLSTAHEHLGNLLIDLGKIDDGLEQLDIVFHYDQSRQGLYQRLVNLLIKRGIDTDAISHYLQARQFGLADGYEVAIKFYQKAVATDPKFSRAFYEMGTTYRYLRNRVQAIEAYRKAIELRPDSPAREELQGMLDQS